MNKSTHMVVLFVATCLLAHSSFSQETASKWENLLREVESLYQKGQYDRATVVATKLLEIAERNTGPDHLDVAESLNLLAGLYVHQGLYAQAEPLSKRSLAIREKALGPDHPDVATSLNNLARLYEAQGQYAQAEPLYKRSLAIGEKALGPDHPEVAERFTRLAEHYRARGQFAQAESNYKHSLAIFEKALDPLDPHVVTTLYNLAELYSNQGQYARAEPLYKRSLAIYEKALGPKHPNVATSLYSLAELYRRQGQYAQAEPLYRRSLKIHEQAVGPEHRDAAASLNGLAALYRDQGQYAQAEPLYTRSLAIVEKSLGGDHLDVATILNNLAALYVAQGRYAQAEIQYKRSLIIYDRTLGPEHPFVATSLAGLARLCLVQGQYAQAEPLYRRSLKIHEKALGPDHPHVATSLNDLGLLYCEQGQYTQAEPLFERSLAISERVLDPHHPNVAIRLNNLASLYLDQGKYVQAEPLFTRSLAISERVLGPHHPDVAIGLNNLANLYRAQSKYAQAEPLFKRSLVIYEKALKHDHPLVATGLNSLAGLYNDQGRYVQAQPLFERSLAISERVLDPHHPDVAIRLNNLASLYLAQGKYAKAEPLMQRALAITRRSTHLSAEVQSEQRQLAMAESRRSYLDTYMSLRLASKRSAMETYAEAFAWKGAVTARQNISRLARGTRDPEVARTLDELQITATRLATLKFEAPEPKNRESWQKQIAELSQRRDDLEGELSRQSAAFRRHKSQQRRTPDEIRLALPSGTALIDFLVFWHCRPPEEGKGKLVYDRRLAAFVVRPDRPVALVDLGSIEPVARAIAAWREDYGMRPSAGQELRRLVWDRLAADLEGADTILISPDGPLAYFPWAALPGKQPGKYLIEERTLAVVPVPQMLPELLESQPDAADSDASLLLVGQIDYDGAVPGKSQPDAVSGDRSAPRSDGVVWSTLPGTAAEAATIKDSFVQRYQAKGLRELRGAEATQEQVRADAPRRRYLHFATHGFFAPPQVRSALAPRERPQFGAEMFSGRQPQVTGFHPGLLSGLVLAGANRPAEAGRDDGILTALEVAELDLSRVELATLSACETGLGQTADGEGVLGLQRAFQVAGCRNVVASLWKVDDAATAALMKVFYYKLWQENKPPIVALREAQLAILRHPEQIGELAKSRGPSLEKTIKLVDQGRVVPASKTAPPRLWAAFVISGAPQVHK